jgi:hypothetical protein
MKQFSIVRNQLFAGFLILSIVFSACSSRDSSSNTNASRISIETAQTRSLPASNPMAGNTAISGNTMTTDAWLAKEEKSSGERYAEIEENPFLESARARFRRFD